MEHTTSPEVTETALELLKGVVAEDEALSLAVVAGTPICDTLVGHIVGRWQRGREFEDHRYSRSFVGSVKRRVLVLQIQGSKISHTQMH